MKLITILSMAFAGWVVIVILGVFLVKWLFFLTT